VLVSAHDQSADLQESVDIGMSDMPDFPDWEGEESEKPLLMVVRGVVFPVL
jgi:hypothetical protein